MSVADSIFGALARFGRPMVLRRTKLGPSQLVIPLEVTVYGTADGYVPKALIGSLIQGESVVIFSNKEIAAAQWPGPPQNGDQIVIDGKQRTISGVDPKYLGTEKLVYVCRVTG